MIPKYRQLFNDSFTLEKYQEFQEDIASDFDYLPTFRMAETPFFISNELKAQLIEGCEAVIDLIKQDNFKQLTEKSLELNHKVPNEDEHTSFLAIDFSSGRDTHRLDGNATISVAPSSVAFWITCSSLSAFAYAM